MPASPWWATREHISLKTNQSTSRVICPEEVRRNEFGVRSWPSKISPLLGILNEQPGKDDYRWKMSKAKFRAYP
jgi:hypothetical protein